MGMTLSLWVFPYMGYVGFCGFSVGFPVGFCEFSWGMPNFRDGMGEDT